MSNLIEDILNSKGRTKILKILSKEGEINVSELAKKVGLNNHNTNLHLKYFEKLGIVKHKEFGRIRIYQLNLENKKSQVMKHFFESWEKILHLEERARKEGKK